MLRIWSSKSSTRLVHRHPAPNNANKETQAIPSKRKLGHHLLTDREKCPRKYVKRRDRNGTLLRVVNEHTKIPRDLPPPGSPPRDSTGHRIILASNSIEGITAGASVLVTRTLDEPER